MYEHHKIQTQCGMESGEDEGRGWKENQGARTYPHFPTMETRKEFLAQHKALKSTGIFLATW